MRAKEEIRARLKYSKAVLEARKKEQALVKLKKYDDAEIVRRKLDQLEAHERQKMELTMEDQAEKKVGNLKNKQQLAMSALLKRIQRDRNEQLKQRQIDSQCLIQRNKNLLNDLLLKHTCELKKTIECIKQALDGAKISDAKDISTPETKATKT